MYSGTNKDSVGPGRYNPKPVSEIYGGKGTAWHKSNSRRELMPKTSSTNLGPGSYNDLRGQGIYNLKSSPAFLSGCKRDSYIPLDDETNTYDEHEKDGNPGPGQYSINTSSFTSAKTMSDYQKFGIGTKRFRTKNSSVPGPGHYTTYDNRQSSTPEIRAPFASTDPRFTQKPNKIPGPGSYEPATIIEPSRKIPSKDEAFGSSEKRFIAKTKEEHPGPGQYELDNRIGIHNSVHRKPLSVFCSKVNKGLSLQNTENPPPGNYEVPLAFDKKKKIPSQPVLVRVNVGLDKILGFNSKDERFKQLNNDLPGPGSYHKMKKKSYQNELARPKTYYNLKKAKTKNQKNVLMGEERFKTKNLKFPGPGDYDDKNNYWSKKTFNIQFTENDF